MKIKLTKHAKFVDLPIGAKFSCNGNECIKKSTRTAILLQFDRVFYFRKNELVKVLS